MVSPEPGNTLTAAYNLGTLTNTRTLTDTLSSGDRDDFYRLTLSSASNFNLALTGLGADANVRLLRDANNNGTVEANEVIASSTLSGMVDEAINRQLTAGTYFIHVSYVSASTNYTLSCSTTNPSNLLPVETNIGSLASRTYSYSDSLSSTDTADIYRFSIPNDVNIAAAQNLGIRDIRVVLHWLNGNANVEVIRDSNSNGIVDAGEVIQGSYASGNTNELIDLPGLGGGTYFIRVYSADNTRANYTLDLTAVKPTIFDPEHQPDRGNSLGQAYYLGTLNGDRFVGGTVSVIDNAGNGDQDFYRFTLGTTSNLEINIGNFPGDTAPFYVLTSVIWDANRNGVVDSGDLLEATTGEHLPAFTGDFISLSGLGVGDYFVRVYATPGAFPLPVKAEYFLALSATPGAGIELEPNNSLQQAQSISLGNIFQPIANLNGTREFSGFVGSSDPNDYYRFSLGTTSNVSLLLNGLTQNANLQLIRDANRNGAIDPGDVIQSSSAAGTNAESIKTLLNAGDYFIRIYSAAGASTNYALTMTGKPTDEISQPANNLLNVETNIGSLSNRTYTYSDSVSSNDPIDIYRFSLAETRNIRVALHWLNGNADVEVIRDVNNNGIVDVGDVIKGSYAGSNMNELINLPSLGSGAYFIRVYSVDNASANYTLDLTAANPN